MCCMLKDPKLHLWLLVWKNRTELLAYIERLKQQNPSTITELQTISMESAQDLNIKMENYRGYIFGGSVGLIQ